MSQEIPQLNKIRKVPCMRSRGVAVDGVPQSMVGGFLGLRRLIQRRQALWWASLLPLTALTWGVSDVYLSGSKELYASRRASSSSPPHAQEVPDYTALRIGVALMWLVVVFAIVNTARVRMGRSLAFLFTVIPISDLVACLRPFLAAQETGAEDAIFLLFHFPPAVAAVAAAQITYTRWPNLNSTPTPTPP